VSTLPTQYGEKVVLRLLDPEKAVLDLDRLGFETRERQALDEYLNRSEGLILTTGPTGSGKSTTLYAMLRAIQSEELNIVTVENPIEYRLPGITQTQINERQGLTFASALRSILRQDPDVILVGEIRDLETAEIAIQAAETGHLVLSTLHTNDSVGAITRLQQIGIERPLIASTLLMVIAQRLIRKVCTTCGGAAKRSFDAVSTIADGLAKQGDACPDCRDTGFRGRKGVYEIFRNTLEAKQMIEAGASELELRDLMRRHGGRPLIQVANQKVAEGMHCGLVPPVGVKWCRSTEAARSAVKSCAAPARLATHQSRMVGNAAPRAARWPTVSRRHPRPIRREPP
jgi:type II secretory ATPase GspE/PulE/Tfp pilus assembly ATPase PilB-like protein